MELLYLLIEDFHRLSKHQEVVFSGAYNYSNKENHCTNRPIAIKISEKDRQFTSLFEVNLLNGHGISAKNYSEKTSFLDSLKHLFCGNDFTGDKFLFNFIICTTTRPTLMGIQNILSIRYYQDYFDEYCYKVNRRFMGGLLFERLLFACELYNYKNFIHEN